MSQSVTSRVIVVAYLTIRIISTLLGWDIADFQKRAVKIEKDKEGPKKADLDCIKAYIKKDRREHEKCRSRSGKFLGAMPEATY